MATDVLYRDFIINELTQAQFDSLTEVKEDEIYAITDAEIETVADNITIIGVGTTASPLKINDQIIQVIDNTANSITDHIADKENPHNVTVEQLGLENVDNTSDLDKPISTATQEALDLKADKSDVEESFEEVNESITNLQNTIDNFDALPDQTNKSGSILTTDGVSASWTTNYTKPTDYATSIKAGLMKPATDGLSVDSVGTLSIVGATDEQVEDKTSTNIALTPANIDQIIKTGLTTNTLTLSDEDRLKLQDWLGIGTLTMRNWK